MTTERFEKLRAFKEIRIPINMQLISPSCSLITWQVFMDPDGDTHW